MTRPSRITAEVDFTKEGKQQGFLRLPYSSHASAYGWIAIPIIVIKNGEGPNVLLMAGNHGDEYEGQLTLIKLCRELEPGAVRGRIIILPAANFPAARAGMRTSPIDSGNLNRSFPGNPDGTLTQMIAHYIESELLPLADTVLDLHSGGSSLQYIPSTLMAKSEDERKTAKMLELMKVFGAPIGYMSTRPQGEDRTLLAAARRSSAVAIGTELGGSGTVTPETMVIAERGVRRVLKHIGSVPDMALGAEPPASRIMEIGGSDYFVYSPDYGLWEPLADLGDDVEAGQPAARVHFPETPWREPVVAEFLHAGTVICKRIPSRTERGDCLYHLGTDIATD